MERFYILSEVVHGDCASLLIQQHVSGAQEVSVRSAVYKKAYLEQNKMEISISYITFGYFS